MINSKKNSLFIGIQKLNNKGFFYIVLSSSFVKVVSFISAIFLPRLLTKSDYGVLTYVDNIRNYIIMVNGLGIANVTIRYCSIEQDEAKKKGIFYFTVIGGIVIDLVLCLLSGLLFWMIPYEFEEAKVLLIAMTFMPVFVFVNEDIQYYLRAVFANKEYSLLAFMYSALMVFFQVLLAWKCGLTGVVIGRYSAAITTFLVGIICLKRIGVFWGAYVKPCWRDVKEYLRFGFIMMVTNMASFMMQLNETFILGLILKDELALADYKVASFILTLSIFMCQAVATFLLPYFVQHADDKKWIWSTFKKVSFVNAIVMIPIHIVLILVSKYVVLVIYGEDYLNTVPVMQMLLIASVGQTVFRMLPGNILGGIGEEKFNLIINIFFLVLHAVVDVIAIKMFGLYGAAVGLVFVYYCSGLLMILKLRRVCKGK